MRGEGGDHGGAARLGVGAEQEIEYFAMDHGDGIVRLEGFGTEIDDKIRRGDDPHPTDLAFDEVERDGEFVQHAKRYMAPPQGLGVEVLHSKRKVSIPPNAKASAAEEPAGLPTTTTVRSFLSEEAVMVMYGGPEMAVMEIFEGLKGDRKVE